MGDLGFDPLKFGDNSATRAQLEMAELKNGRLAMLAFSGMIHQTFVTGKPLFGTLIGLCHHGVPTIGIIDQCVLKERWLGVRGLRTTLNGAPVRARGAQA